MSKLFSNNLSTKFEYAQLSSLCEEKKFAQLLDLCIHIVCIQTLRAKNMIRNAFVYIISIVELITY